MKHLDVDGLGTVQPDDPELYRGYGKLNAELGYVNRTFTEPIKR